MNVEQIKTKILSDEYDFMRTHPDLHNNITLLTLGGSHAYGLETENSDLDIRGVCLNTKHEILTMNCKDKPIVNTVTDTTIYYLKQIIQLLANGNPNTLEILGTKDEHLLICDINGHLLRNNANLFLSRKVAYSFGQYAAAQLRRLQNALARDNYHQAEKEEHIFNSIQGQMHHLQSNYTSFEDKNISLYLDKSDKVDFDKEVFININLQNYPLRDLKSMYSDMANVIKDYESLGHRNNKKTDIKLDKHVMHIFRLLIMGAEILEGKGVNTYREYDKDFLMKLRHGEFVSEVNGVKDYSEVFRLVDEYDKRFKYAKDNTCLPDNPNYDVINEIVMQINRGVVK